MTLAPQVLVALGVASFVFVGVTITTYLRLWMELNRREQRRYLRRLWQLYSGAISTRSRQEDLSQLAPFRERTEELRWMIWSVVVFIAGGGWFFVLVAAQSLWDLFASNWAPLAIWIEEANRLGMMDYLSLSIGILLILIGWGFFFQTLRVIIRLKRE